MRANLREVAEAASHDPKKALLDRLGAVDQITIAHNLVLVATYIPPDRTKGGIIRPDRNLEEDRFQGKVGLVLKKGPLAFKDDGAVKFGGFDVEVGDWVIYRPSDALEMFISNLSKENSNEGISCRYVEDALIKSVVADPSLIY